MLPPSVLASLRFLGGAFWAALTAGEQFDLVRELCPCVLPCAPCCLSPDQLPG
jgi:hypothetical protein